MNARADGPGLTGQRVGPYLIEALIGAGGMGQVYRARDTRLDRDVAIKVLPDELARTRIVRRGSSGKPRSWPR
jgi:serine/threonine protein kinase